MLNLEEALRLTEVLLALAFVQQSAEHLAARGAEGWLFGLRGALALVLLWGGVPACVLLALCVHAVVVLHWFDGPYNGGSDKMGLLVLACLTAAHLLPEGAAQEVAFAYLAVQVVLSYFMSGQIKLVNPAWRKGHALRDVFDFSAYPVSGDLRAFASRSKLMWAVSWAVIVFELAFPLSLLWSTGLVLAMALATGFHLANALLFGLNRFVWFWIASYPALIWFQGRVF